MDKNPQLRFWPGVLLALSLFLPAGCQRFRALLGPEACVLSGREIHSEMAVKLAVEGGGPAGSACCLRCAVTYAEQTGKTVDVSSVTDYQTGKTIRPDDATYVSGSDVVMCLGAPLRATQGRREVEMSVWDRCSPSAIAFRSRADAESFQRIHGGKIETFTQIVGANKVVVGH